MLRPWPRHSLKLFYVSSDWKDSCLVQCCERLAANTGSRNTLTQHNLVMLFSVNRIVSLDQNQTKPTGKANTKKKGLVNYLKARLCWSLWSFDSLSAVWIECSLSFIVDEIWGKKGRRRAINIRKCLHSLPTEDGDKESWTEGRRCCSEILLLFGCICFFVCRREWSGVVSQDLRNKPLMRVLELFRASSCSGWQGLRSSLVSN